jgi:hypothetical protein
LTPKQAEIFLSQSRSKVIVAGRRFGKSCLSIAELTRAARSGLGEVCWYAAPSYRQAKTVLWPALKSAVPFQWVAKKSEIDLAVELKGTGSVIALRGADNFDSLRGVGLDLVRLDEFSDIAPRTWHEVVRPALADKQGKAIIQGIPKGFNELHGLFVQARELPDWRAFHFATAEGGVVSQEELDVLKAT